MKFRDPKTGKVFDNIQQAQENFCPNTPCKDKPYEMLAKNCALCRINMRSNGWHELCDMFCDSHPTEAAHLMGYEVIEDNVQKTFTETDLLAVLDKLADSCDTSNADESVTGYKLFDYHWKCGNANAVNFIKSALGIESAKKTVEEANMEKKAKPRLAEVLGVEVGERFYVGRVRKHPIYVDELGDLLRDDGDGKRDYADCATLCALIQSQEVITKAPRLTEAELAICKDVGAKWVSRGALGTKTVVLWDAKPECFDDGTFGSTDTAHKLARMYTGFDSVHPGNCICVEEAGEK